MKTASLVFGIFSILIMIVGFFPCLGALNWINIPIAGIGLIISIIALTQNIEGESNGKAVGGIIMCGIAMIFGLIRLLMGGGIV
jgi:hypothetical protein